MPYDRQFTDEKIRGIAEWQEVIGVVFDVWMLTPDFDEVRLGNSRTSLATVVAHMDHICPPRSHRNGPGRRLRSGTIAS